MATMGVAVPLARAAGAAFLCERTRAYERGARGEEGTQRLRSPAGHACSSAARARGSAASAVASAMQ
jgi:hypothetical protein